ncbi:hypothetical protein QFZ27_001922 [Inquilinus ginsengisoli]|uniref:hypothetical protein n=1 Tax=Inquilinus ginsengisoli TaxID=363840 RepID=UPI003D19D8AF
MGAVKASMANSGKALWSYSTPAALGAAVAGFIVGLLVLFGVRRASGWPSEAAIDWVVLILLIISFAPVGLRLLDFLAERRAVLGSKWFNLDLSRMDLTRAAAAGTEVLPANLGITGPVVSDTAPMDIMEALRTASRQPFVVVDIRDGDAWWVTRLIALSAGAVRRLAPEAIVFMGRRENRPDQFLGWATPAVVLEAILQDRDEYRARYEKAVALARHLVFFRGTELLPPGAILHPDVLRYTDPPHNYKELGDAALEQIVMDQLARHGGPGGPLEAQPDRLTLARLNTLFAAVLVTESVNITWTAARQVAAVLAVRAPFVASVRDGAFVSMIRCADAERAILAQLVEQARDRHDARD